MRKNPPKPKPMKYRDKTRCIFLVKGKTNKLCTNEEVRGIIIVDEKINICTNCILFKFGLKARVRYGQGNNPVILRKGR